MYYVPLEKRFHWWTRNVSPTWAPGVGVTTIHSYNRTGLDGWWIWLPYSVLAKTLLAKNPESRNAHVTISFVFIYFGSDDGYCNQSHVPICRSHRITRSLCPSNRCYVRRHPRRVCISFFSFQSCHKLNHVNCLLPWVFGTKNTSISFRTYQAEGKQGRQAR